MNVRMTRRQADLVWRLLDSYIDAAGETMENRSDLAMAKRVRSQITIAQVRASLSKAR